jgi:hypothetical protein
LALRELPDRRVAEGSMRLSQWRAAAPHRDAGSPKVSAVVDPILAAFGAGPDPHCWVVWGDEPSVRYVILVPTDPGLIHCFVRVSVPGEGPRATTKLVRWNRVAIGELGVETTNGHRLLSFQLEQQVLRGVDAEADAIAAFALRVIAAIDGRPLPPVEETARRIARPKTAGVKPGSPNTASGKAAAATTAARFAAKPAPSPKGAAGSTRRTAAR